MKKKKSALLTGIGIGIWASGMPVGANVVDLFSIAAPSWHPQCGLRLT
ncbi:MAG: hypothetical protein ACI8QS_000495 [Planctomycetota bacterium]|jgi:hypothetical protein